ncbi:MAG: Nicotinamide-nucleotide amidohydrolase PncC [Bacteroidia bacterium]|nr:Nicotinamide-nucleotide amidohydrolase PncC [Bacteroidia bacterium]
MLCEIITIGDEILIGQIVDTNSAWMGEQLNLAGIKVHQITSVSDNAEHIVKALDEAKNRVDLILITGGLGPTKDDLTKHTLVNYFNTKLRFDEDVYQHVKALFARFGREVTELNKKQAEVPESCIVIHNANGTAPGMWFEKENKIFISMPGVPYEMKKMMSAEILPRLKQKFSLPAIVHRTVLTQGIGESFLSEIIADWENSLAEKNIKLAYLPSPGMVRLRLSASGNDETTLRKTINNKVSELEKIIPQHIYGYEKDKLEEIIGKLLKQKNQTLALAESCSGGLIAHMITSVPGSSAYFMGGVVSYSNQSKMNQLGVKKETLEKHGAVSEETVTEMALGVNEKFITDWAVATSGIAGPDGGTAEKPVGTVWIAVAGPNGMKTKKFQFGGDRERNIQVTAITALNMLRKALIT